LVRGEHGDLRVPVVLCLALGFAPCGLPNPLSQLRLLGDLRAKEGAHSPELVGRELIEMGRGLLDFHVDVGIEVNLAGSEALERSEFDRGHRG